MGNHFEKGFSSINFAKGFTPWKTLAEHFPLQTHFSKRFPPQEKFCRMPSSVEPICKLLHYPDSFCRVFEASFSHH